MTHLYFFIVAASFAAIDFAKPEPIGFKIVNDINKFRSENPSVKLEPAAIGSAKFHYILGARRAGDTKFGNIANSNSNSSPRDYEIRLNLPGAGPTITYVDLTVEQKSAIHNVYITSGGIGQKHMSILVEAKNTPYLNSNAVFYGL